MVDDLFDAFEDLFERRKKKKRRDDDRGDRDRGDRDQREAGPARPEPRAVFCVDCGARNESGGRFCIECGEVLPAAGEEMRCVSCNEVVPLKAKFCPRCGTRTAPER